MKPLKILVVDDEKGMCEFLEIMLTKEGYEVCTTSDSEEAAPLFRKLSPDIVIADIRMQPVDGLSLLKEVKEIDPEANVILITAHASVETAVTALREGARDYLIKPFKIDQVRACIRRATSTSALTSRDPVVLDRLQTAYRPANIIGWGPQMQGVYRLIEKVKDSGSTVLISGESGTGKELVAKAIHYGGIRRDKPFVSVNCGALPENLLESELFGHEKGSFTGAVRTKEGLFEVADGGTFFLDEVGEMNQAIQVKLLRALQEHEIMRIGGSRPIQVDVRVIAATSKDLNQELTEGRFRDDLFYRLSVIPVRMPSLSERRGDIPGLARHFLDSFAAREKKPRKELTQEALDALSAYSWPGNVRELQNVMERIVALEEKMTISARDLPLLGSSSTVPSGSPAEPTLKSRTYDYERKLIGETLEKTGGNVTKAASLLKLTRQGLQYKIKKYGIQ